MKRNSPALNPEAPFSLPAFRQQAAIHPDSNPPVIIESEEIDQVAICFYLALPQALSHRHNV